MTFILGPPLNLCVFAALREIRSPRESSSFYDDTMSIVIAGRSLVLVGFMGSGKSSVGRELAKRWNFRFVDTDAMIRHKYDLSIPEIFAKHGEDFFREAEYQALVRLRGICSTVIATGGGIVIQPRNLPLLRALGPVVWLCADQTTILDRVGKSTHRPMLNQADPQESVARLLKERAPLYHQAADLRIETSGLTHREVADRVVSGLDEFRASDQLKNQPRMDTNRRE
jgi:shikimate kinase